MADVTDPTHALTAERPAYMWSSTVIPGVVAVVDSLSIVVAALVPYLVLIEFNLATVEYYVFCAGFVLFSANLLFNRAELYRVNAIMRPIARSDYIFVSLITAFLLFLTVAFSLKVSEEYSRLWIFSFAAGAAVLVLGSRLAICQALRMMSAGRVIGRSLVVLGVGEQSRQFLRRLNRLAPYFTTVTGVFDPEHARIGASFEGHPVLGGVDDLIACARHQQIDDVVVAMPWADDEQLISLVETLKQLPINVYISTDLVGFHLTVRPVVGHLDDLPMFEVIQRPISGWSYVLKTLEDYVLSSMIVVLISPLLLIIALLIKIDSPGPVFFMQRRLGFNNQEFLIYKFRSMYHNTVPDAVTIQASRGDPRVTRIGRILRKTSIDELPQLLNVLNGTMSLVGPRPHAIDHNVDYGRQIRGYFARHKVKPGITGWAQVNGLRGETDALEKMAERVKYDVHYAENWSLLFDLRILVMTVLVVLFQKSAY